MRVQIIFRSGGMQMEPPTMHKVVYGGNYRNIMVLQA